MMGQQKEANNKLEELTDPLSLKEKKLELLALVIIIYLYIYILYVYIQDSLGKNPLFNYIFLNMGMGRLHRALVSSEFYIPKLLILFCL